MVKKNLSVLKRHRQSERRRLRNRTVKSALKSITKKLYLSITKQDREEAMAALTRVIKALNKAASKGVIHKNMASRRVSRLTKKVNQLSSVIKPSLQGHSRTT